MHKDVLYAYYEKIIIVRCHNKNSRDGGSDWKKSLIDLNFVFITIQRILVVFNAGLKFEKKLSMILKLDEKNKIVEEITHNHENNIFIKESSFFKKRANEQIRFCSSSFTKFLPTNIELMAQWA